MSQPLTVENELISPDCKDTLESGVSRFLVCGLGSLAHAANSACALVIRTFDPRFSDNLARQQSPDFGSSNP